MTHSTDQQHYCDAQSRPSAIKFLREGSGTNDILVVGESLTKGWVELGDPFFTRNHTLAPSIRNLGRLLSNFGISLEDIAFTNIAKCYLGKNKTSLSSCGVRSWPVFEQQLTGLKTKLIITLGLQTLGVFQQWLKEDIKIGEITSVNIYGQEYQLLPLFHPSPINPHNFARNFKIFQRYQNSFSR